MGEKYIKSPCGITSRRMGMHGNCEAGKEITQSQSRGDNIERGRTLASMMTTMMRTSRTIKRSEVVTKIKEIVGVPMPETESAKLNQKVERRRWHEVYSIGVDDT